MAEHNPPRPSPDIADLIALMAALRTPGTGCAWDLEQNFATIAPYTIEEAHEVQDAIQRGDMEDLCEELGDLLLQVVFHARMAQEAGHFSFGDVVRAITAKLIRRHPHVFGDQIGASPEAIKSAWATIKAEEKAERAARRGLAPDAPAGALAGVPRGLPPGQRAVRLQDKAAKVGFDWPHIGLVLDKAGEELAELRAAVAAGDGRAIGEELGDLLFVLANVGRWTGHDPDAAMAGANAKFEQRFAAVEGGLAAAGKRPEDATLDEMEALWQAAKRTSA
jgi:ATP diphosphatase